MVDPSQDELPRRRIASSIPAAIASGESGSTRTAALPLASSSDACEETTAGVPLAIASTTGIPKPSNLAGKTNASAPR